MNSRASFFYGLFFLMMAQCMVGLNIVGSKYLLTVVPPFFLLMMRFTLASAILFPLHWLTPARNHPLSYYFAQITKKEWIFMISQALSAGFLFNLLMLMGLNYTNANVAGIITSALPAIIAIMSWLVLGETISGKKSVSIILATLGLVVIAWAKYRQHGGEQSFIGDIFIFLALIPEAAYYILSKLSPNRLPIFFVSTLMNGMNAIALFLVFALFSHEPIAITPFNWSILVGLGLSTSLFYIFWLVGCLRVDGIMASLSTAVMPIATVIFAQIIFGEHLTQPQFIGMVMVLISIFICAIR